MPAPNMVLIQVRDPNDNSLLGVFAASATQFGTGSVGFRGQAKFEIAGERYQVQAQLVKIGSKAVASETPAAE